MVLRSEKPIVASNLGKLRTTKARYSIEPVPDEPTTDQSPMVGGVAALRAGDAMNVRGGRSMSKDLSGMGEFALVIAFNGGGIVEQSAAGCPSQLTTQPHPSHRREERRFSLVTKGLSLDIDRVLRGSIRS
jgi:hypothetical protein